MRRRAYISFLIIILICFGIGIFSTLLSHNNGSPSITPDTPAPTEIHSNQTLLILGVDQFDNPDPMLYAIWFVIHRIPEEEVVLFGIPLNYQVNESGTDTLRSIFSWTVEEGVDGVSTEFMNELQNAVPHVRLDMVVIMDETFFAALVDYMGGIPAGDIILPGLEAIAAQRLLFSEPDALLEFQANSLDVLRYQLPTKDPSMSLSADDDLRPLFDMIPDHCIVPMDPGQLILKAPRFLFNLPESIRIELMPHSSTQ